jgi:hypothetical protein
MFAVEVVRAVFTRVWKWVSTWVIGSIVQTSKSQTGIKKDRKRTEEKSNRDVLETF